MTRALRSIRTLLGFAAWWTIGGCAATSSIQHLNVGAVVHLEVAEPPDVLRPGDIAPDFSLREPNGSSFELTASRTSPTLILVFYRGNWCPWCRRQLSELSGELEAFSARGATIVGISVDAAAETQRFARDYHITFPLLIDTDGAVSRRYVGRERDGTAIPGVYVISGDHRILERHLGESAGDRLLAAEIVALLDRHRAGPATTFAPLHGGFSPLDRWQLGLGVSGGAAYLPDDRRIAHYAAIDLVVLAPVLKYLAFGATVRGALSEPNVVDANLAVKIRIPAFGDLGEIYLLPAGGFTASFERARAADAGWNAGGAVGLQFAITPAWASYVELGMSHHHIGPDASVAQFRFFASLGITWLR